MIKYHLKICLLKVACEFERVGCKETPRREDLEEHGHENTEKHLALMATTTISFKNTHHELIERLVKKIDDQKKS